MSNENRTPVLDADHILAILGDEEDYFNCRVLLEDGEEPEFGLHFYEIGYYSYEDSGYHQLVHKDRFTKEQIQALIVGVAVEIVKARREKENQRLFESIGDSPYELHQQKVRRGWSPTFKDLYQGVVKVLCADYGFKRLKFTTSFSVNGWSYLRDENIESDDLLDSLSRAIKEILGEIKN